MRKCEKIQGDQQITCSLQRAILECVLLVQMSSNLKYTNDELDIKKKLTKIKNANFSARGCCNTHKHFIHFIKKINNIKKSETGQ